MAKKKRDFWDDVDEEVEVSDKHQKEKSSYDDSYKGAAYHDDTEDDYSNYDDDSDDRFHLTRCMPFKIVTRLLLLVAAAVIGISGYICYKYIDDRYDGGYTNNYFSSKGFSIEYNDSVEKVLKIMEAVENDASLADGQDKMDALVKSVFDTEGNFSFLVQDENKVTLYASSEDAKERIESSHHFMTISTIDNQFTVDTTSGSIPVKGLNEAGWKSTMDSFSKTYMIYMAVDNNLTEGGGFYQSYMDYQAYTGYFNIARIALIAGFVVFIILLILCVISTGMRNGTNEVKLSVFDYIYTEFAAIISLAVLGAILYGLFYVHRHGVLGNNDKYIIMSGLAVFYIILIRSYFSLVRRIKTGRFVADSLIYRLGHLINRGLNHLPKAIKAIIVVLFLIALNGGLVYALLHLRDYTVKGIPIVFAAVPVVFIIELIAFICCLFGGVPDNSEDEEVYGDYDGEAEDEDKADEDGQPSKQSEGNPDDWSNVDFGNGVKVEAPREEESQYDFGKTQQNVIIPTAEKTVFLSDDEVNTLKQQSETPETHETPAQTVQTNNTSSIVSEAASAARATAQMQATQLLDADAVNAALLADETLLDFIQLNKDVRKMFRIKLKNKNLGVTLRAPEKPILLDIDKSNAIRVLSILFDNVEKYAEEGSRVYIEMYTQKGKMVYMMKNTIKEELLGEVTGEMGPSLKEAKHIVQAEGGKFITAVDGQTFKAGILLSTAN